MVVRFPKNEINIIAICKFKYTNTMDINEYTYWWIPFPIENKKNILQCENGLQLLKIEMGFQLCHRSSMMP